jgi:hypothetical protein
MASRSAMHIQDRRAANRAMADPNVTPGWRPALPGLWETVNEKRS